MGNWGTWQEWTAGVMTFLTGLAAIWATLRATWRKDRAAIREDGDAEASRRMHDHEDALEKCWEFARHRERWYDKEKRSLKEQLASQDERIEELRTELHATRNSWSQEQLLRVRLEEELKYLRMDLTDRERDRDRRDHPPGAPPPPPQALPPGGGTSG